MRIDVEERKGTKDRKGISDASEKAKEGDSTGGDLSTSKFIQNAANVVREVEESG